MGTDRAVVVRSSPSLHEQLTEIAHAAKRHWGYPEEWIALWRNDLTVTPADIERDATFHAVVGGEIAGFCRVVVEGGSAEVEDMWVLPGFMGRGVGRSLFDHLVGEASNAGAQTLRIVSDPNAVGFYEGMGATRCGEVPSEPAPRRLPVLSLELGSPERAPTPP